MANQERNTEATDDAIMSSSLEDNLYLPMDIIFDILNCLPIKSLLQFKCMCKTFCHVISNPTFISSHLLHHRTITTTVATIVTFKHRTTTSLSLLQSFQNSNNLVVRIVSFKLQTRVEAYSTISDCWREIQVMDLRFYIHKLSCEAIVNGSPYWLLSTASNHCLCFTWFDVQNEAFVMLPRLDFSGFYDRTSVHWKLMDWKDNAAVVVCGLGNPCVDVWMMEDYCGGESNWCKKFVIGPVLGVERFGLLQCMKNGEIIAKDARGDVTLDVHFQSDLRLDSFDNVEIVLALEEQFELEIPNKETNKIDSCFLAIEIRNFEVKITLKKMKSNKVLGPDGIPIEAWKYLDDIVLVDETREEVNTKLET
ncbi:hypothetical protein HYC85_010669 [Camellia sinensis]|uniref:F-box domain-containing protein n=1 Tax=Camellia sinensis TaxID=4442 RepID=A0A7J7HJH2_CAMSI|nr:hypothetical protein HYC85_010669 [Camellia sinensis]